MARTRRTFLKNCCVLGAAGLASQLERLGMVSARAQSGSGYKALVCVFFFGGNDANNMIVPLDSRYNAYRTMRGPGALASNTLLPAADTGYGLHPSLPAVQQLFDQQYAAAVFNVGTLVRPTSKGTLNSTQLPRNLYSHSDQTQQWQTSDPNGGSTGWGGRVNDIITGYNTGSLPPGITVSGGNSLFLSGPTTKGLNLSNSSSFGLLSFGDWTNMDIRLASLQRVLTFDTGLKMVGAANGVLGEAIHSAQEIDAVLAGAPELPVAFPDSGLGQQLAQVAQVIAVQGALGMNRQIFFAGLGGFDNHEDLVNKQQELLTDFDAAVSAFFATLENRGVMNEVTLFTESEFNRTGNANANIGTDHAWGSHHLVLGGAVAGGETYGTFPTLELEGPDDVGDRGTWIPTTSLDQYAATLGSWFGVSGSDLQTISPNLSNFSPTTLGFV
jgi:uncharacterized protein (DUF1501 family)